MAEPGPSLSVVVPTRDRPNLLGPCIASIVAALAPGDELLVVDSASTDPAAALAATAAAGDTGRRLRCDRPGASHARNVGWRASANEVVAFVDDDVRVDSTWADGLRRCLADHPETAFVTGRIGVPPDQAGVDRPVAVKDDPDPAVIDRTTTGTLGHSANLAVRRDALEAVGGFDELLGAGARFRAAEDYDLFDRLLAAGLTGRYEPAAAAWHDQWRGRGDLVRLDWAYGVGTGARLAKLVRTDPARAGTVARAALWTGGLRLLPGLVRARYELGIATVVARSAGTCAGFVSARARSLRGGVLQGGSSTGLGE